MLCMVEVARSYYKHLPTNALQLWYIIIENNDSCIQVNFDVIENADFFACLVVSIIGSMFTSLLISWLLIRNCM